MLAGGETARPAPHFTLLSRYNGTTGEPGTAAAEVSLAPPRPGLQTLLQVLQQAEIPILSNRECRAWLAGQGDAGMAWIGDKGTVRHGSSRPAGLPGGPGTARQGRCDD